MESAPPKKAKSASKELKKKKLKDADHLKSTEIISQKTEDKKKKRKQDESLGETENKVSKKTKKSKTGTKQLGVDVTEHNPPEPSEPIVESSKDEKPKKRKRDKVLEDTKEKKKRKKDKKAKDDEELEIDITAPNPPSKKAKRLQKKGKPVPRLPDTSQPPSSKPTENVHPERKALVKEIPRAEFGVWIGNMSYKSLVADLRGWLVRGDKRVADKEITRINLPLNADNQSKGYEH
jgi:hypothetical protein